MFLKNKKTSKLAAALMSAVLSLGLLSSGANATEYPLDTGASTTITSRDWKLVGKMEGGQLIPAEQLGDRPRSRMEDSILCRSNLERIRVEDQDVPKGHRGNLVTVAGTVCPVNMGSIHVKVEIQRQNNWWWGTWIGAKSGEASSRGNYLAAQRIQSHCNDTGTRKYRAAAAFEYTDKNGYVYETKIAGPEGNFPCEI